MLFVRRGNVTAICVAVILLVMVGLDSAYFSLLHAHRLWLILEFRSLHRYRAVQELARTARVRSPRGDPVLAHRPRFDLQLLLHRGHRVRYLPNTDQVLRKGDANGVGLLCSCAFVFLSNVSFFAGNTIIALSTCRALRATVILDINAIYSASDCLPGIRHTAGKRILHRAFSPDEPEPNLRPL